MPRVVDIRRHRDRLLERLAVHADHPAESFEQLPSSTVDTVVSLALAETDEDPKDSLLVVLLCISVLAADGQFARLYLLADKLNTLADRVEVERPFLALAVSAFGHALKGDTPLAMWSLNERLGLGDRQSDEYQRTSADQASDVLMAAMLRSVLAADGSALPQRSIEIALAHGDGWLLTFAEAAVIWSMAAASADPGSVLRRSDSTFSGADLRPYVDALEMNVLYPAQKRAIEGGATHDRDVVVSLPTSSGKTLIAEFRIVGSLTRSPGSRAIYVAPYRLLARQVVRSFRPRLSALGLTVRDLGSSFDPSSPSHGSEGPPDVAVCTPERLDALLRLCAQDSQAGNQAVDLFESVNVLVFDEAQLIGRSGRGPRFEFIIARIRAKFPDIRILALSAASSSVDSLASWISDAKPVTGHSRPTGTLEILWGTDGVMHQRVDPRPTQVAKVPRGTPKKDAAKLILSLRSDYSPVLAVETSRVNSEGLAREIVQMGPAIAAQWRSRLSSDMRRQLNIAIEQVVALLGSGHSLVRCMENGVAFHHAGVPTSVLEEVETLAARRILRVVCATTTVAEGADLPFRVVVLPHLNFPGPTRRLDRDLYLNIVGRAGRANVTVEGLVFILDSDAPTLRASADRRVSPDTAATRKRRFGLVTRVNVRTTETAFPLVHAYPRGHLGA